MSEFDVVFIDLYMDIMDGLELCKCVEIKWFGFFVVVVIGEVSFDVVVVVLWVGVYDFLIKLIDIKLFKLVVCCVVEYGKLS